MNDLLNYNQRRSVTIVLRNFEEHLRMTSAWLDGAEENGILYHRKLSLPSAQRQAAKQCVETALETIVVLAQKIDLEPEVEDSAGIIRGEMSVDWANLSDLISRKMKQYGDVNPELRNVLDPAILHLAQLAMELVSILFSDPVL